MAKPRKGVVPPQFRKTTKKAAGKKAGAKQPMPAALKKKLGRTGI